MKAKVSKAVIPEPPHREAEKQNPKIESISIGIAPRGQPRGNRIRHIYGPWISAAVVCVGLTCGASLGMANSILGSASSFAVLAGSTVTSTGATVLTGDLGVSPGTAITGFPPGTVTGAIHFNDPTASQGQTDLTIGFNSLNALPSSVNLSGTNLGGLTLTQGVYKFNSSAELSGTLTLTGPGTFVFQIGSSFTADNNSIILLTGGANPASLYFAVGTSATVGTGASLAGDIIALQSISLATGSALQGAALAIDGAVTLQSNTITMTSIAETSTPEPSSFTLFGIAAMSMIVFRRVRPKTLLPIAK